MEKIRRPNFRWWHRRKTRLKSVSDLQQSKTSEFGSCFLPAEREEILRYEKLELQQHLVRQGFWHFGHHYAQLCELNPDPVLLLRSMFRTSSETALFTTMSATVYSNVGDVMQRLVCWAKDDPNHPLIIDTGASTSLSPSKDDFITYQEIHNQRISGIAGAIAVLGKGKVEWTIHDDNGKPHKIHTEAYHAPDARDQLFRPYPFLKQQPKTKHEGYLLLNQEGAN